MLTLQHKVCNHNSAGYIVPVSLRMKLRPFFLHMKYEVSDTDEKIHGSKFGHIHERRSRPGSSKT